ncbi:hypothetical protein JCM8547_004273 [Rhodosporidiobolus lusitaniae]
MCRILVLPGHLQSKTLYAGRIAQLRRELEEDDIELVIVNPTHLVQPRTEPDFAPFAYESDRSNTWAAYQWWGVEGEDELYKKRERQDFEATLRYLRHILETQGPFDGVWGFSQGGATAALVAALCENPSLDPIFAAPPKILSLAPIRPMKFAVIIAGFIPAGLGAEKYYTKKVRTPLLYVYGTGDVLVGEHRAEPLINSFSNRRVVFHSGGHFTPTKPTWRRFFRDYLRCFRTGYNAWQDVKLLTSPTSSPPNSP